jgi:GTP pyrophosphokinase
MLLAMARGSSDQMADRSTTCVLLREKWGRIIGSNEIYAPIAHRLGLNQPIGNSGPVFPSPAPLEICNAIKAVEKPGAAGEQSSDVQKRGRAAFAAVAFRYIAGREKSLYSIYRKMVDKHLSFAQVTDIYGFRVLVPEVIDCYTALGTLHQLYKPVPGKFKDHIAIAKVNGYQSLHTTLVGPSGVNVEFQVRTEPMHIVAESGVAAHWLYKEKAADGTSSDRLGAQWLQSLLDIQDETRDAAEFWDHVKVDLFPDAVYVFTPKSQIMALPRGATVVDFAYAIHSNVGDRTVAAKIGGELVPLRTELKNGDVIEIITAPVSAPNPSWLSFVRTGRARSKIRHHLKTMAHTESEELGGKLLAQALRSEGIEHLPDDSESQSGIWEKLLRFTGNKTRSELLADIGLGKRIANIVAKRLVNLLAEQGEKPNAVLLTRERYGTTGTPALTGLALDGSENASVQFAKCCRPIPGDAIVGYLGRGEGLIVHAENCPTAKKLQNKDSERFIQVEWADRKSGSGNRYFGNSDKRQRVL